MFALLIKVSTSPDVVDAWRAHVHNAVESKTLTDALALEFCGVKLAQTLRDTCGRMREAQQTENNKKKPSPKKPSAKPDGPPDKSPKDVPAQEQHTQPYNRVRQSSVGAETDDKDKRGAAKADSAPSTRPAPYGAHRRSSRSRSPPRGNDRRGDQ